MRRIGNPSAVRLPSGARGRLLCNEGSAYHKPRTTLTNFKTHLRPPAPGRRADGSAPARRSVTAGLREAEAELRHGLVGVRLVGRIPSPRDRWGSVGTPRWARIRRTGSRSVMTATTRRRPRQRGHSRTSTENDRRRRDAQSTLGDVAYNTPPTRRSQCLTEGILGASMMTSPGLDRDLGGGTSALALEPPLRWGSLAAPRSGGECCLPAGVLGVPAAVASGRGCSRSRERRPSRRRRRWISPRRRVTLRRRRSGRCSGTPTGSSR